MGKHILSPESLRIFADKYVTETHNVWAWQHYESTVRRLIEEFRCRMVLEIGGGRFPLFDHKSTTALGIDLAINDISQRELDRAPGWLHKVCFDIAAPTFPGGEEQQQEEQQYDLVMSRMVMEHVRDAEQTYRNIFTFLRPGGVFLNFHPVLYSPPFVINWLLPDGLTRRVLRTFVPLRTDEGIPKFPARYSYCTISSKTEAMIRGVGFSEVLLLPFYGHNYFHNIPGLREMDNLLTRWARKHDRRYLAAFCYALGRR